MSFYIESVYHVGNIWVRPWAISPQYIDRAFDFPLSVYHVGNIWVRPWAISPQYIDRAFDFPLSGGPTIY